MLSKSLEKQQSEGKWDKSEIKVKILIHSKQILIKLVLPDTEYLTRESVSQTWVQRITVTLKELPDNSASNRHKDKGSNTQK